MLTKLNAEDGWYGMKIYANKTKVMQFERLKDFKPSHIEIDGIQLGKSQNI